MSVVTAANRYRLYTEWSSSFVGRAVVLERGGGEDVLVVSATSSEDVRMAIPIAMPAIRPTTRPTTVTTVITVNAFSCRANFIFKYILAFNMQLNKNTKTPIYWRLYRSRKLTITQYNSDLCSKSYSSSQPHHEPFN